MGSRKLKRLLTATLAAGMLLGGVSAAGSSDGKYHVEAASKKVSEGWHKTKKGWWYALSDGSYLSGGWKKVDGKWYFFDKEGYIAVSEWIKGYWLGKSGAWTYKPRGSWHKNSKGWWYGDTSGWYAKNESCRIDGVEYRFDAKGYLVEKAAYGEGITDLSRDAQKLNVPEMPMSAAHADALSKSGVMLLQKTMEQGEDKNANFLISPASLQIALGMTAAGSDAGTQTQKELMSLLLPGLNEGPDALNQEMATFAGRMKNATGVSWNVANSVWVNNNGEVKFRDSYISDVTNYYKAELYAAPFDESTVKEINAWVNKNTRERIPTIIDRLSEDARIALVNAMAFDGEWKEQYEDDDIHEDQEFTNADGTKSKVVMLSSEESGYISYAGGLGFVKPYKGNEYSFVAILPPEGMTVEDYLKEILKDEKSFAGACMNLNYGGEVYAVMPEFKADYGKTMDDILKGLGLNEAYSDSAHFRAMITDDSYPVKIGTVAHKAMIEVDRKGTKAAAATAVIMYKANSIDPGETVVIRLDRPFLYAIIDNTNGVPLFLGAQNKVEEE